MDWQRVLVDEPNSRGCTAYHNHFNHFHMAQPPAIALDNRSLLQPPSLSHYQRENLFCTASKRRFRTNFTEAQALFLENSFRGSHYPDHNAKKEMAAYLNLPEDRITVWFQNRRAKWRRKEIRDKLQEKFRSTTSSSYSYDSSYYLPTSADGAHSQEAQSQAKYESGNPESCQVYLQQPSTQV